MSDNKNHKHHSHKKNKHIFRKIVIGVFVLLVLSVIGYGAFVYSSAKKTLNSSYKSAGEKQAASSLIASHKPINILLLGVDTGEFGRNYQGRTDTMIIATVNPENKTTTLTSIPRDTMAEIVGTEDFDFERINAAYSRGGAKMALNSISELVNVPLEYYVTVNMGGLEKIVDAVGGVKVDVPFDFDYEGYQFKKGETQMDGAKALAYSRMRYDDPKGDYGRQERQQQVIIAAIKGAVSMNSLTNFQTVLNSISKNMTTNLSFDDMVAIFKDYRGYAETIKQDHIQGISAMWGKAMIQIAPNSELQRVSDNIRKESGLSKETLNNQVIIQNNKNVSENGFDFNNTNNEEQFVVYDK